MRTVEKQFEPRPETQLIKAMTGINPHRRRRLMNRFGLITGLAIVVLLPTGAMSADQHAMVQPDSLKWTAAPPVLPTS